MVRRRTILFGTAMKRNRKIALALGASVVFVLASLAALIVLGPPGPDFVCHRALDGALRQWQLETTNEVQLPNVAGSSSQSLALLIPYIGRGTEEKISSATTGMSRDSARMIQRI